MSLGRDVGREGIDRILRQEMVNVQLVDAHLRIIGHHVGCQFASGIEGDEGAAFQLHVTLTFAQGHVSGIACAIGPQSAIDLHPVGNPIGATHLGIDQRYQEVQFLRLTLHLQVGLHPTDVCDVLGLSAQRGMDRCG